MKILHCRARSSRAAIIPAGMLVLLALACGHDPTGERPADPPTFSSVSVVAGGEGVILGTRLDGLPNVVTVDGRSAAVSVHTATEMRFAVPPGRSCEVEGRPISVSVGALHATAPLVVPTAIRMQPGESRVLSREELTSVCLQLPADQSFVLSALNPALDEGSGAEPLFVVSTATAGGSAPSAAAAFASPRKDRIARADATRARTITGTDFYSADPPSFDARYATAAPGDTVRWVDFRSPAWFNNGNICNAPKASVPTFGAVVAAVSSSGRTVIAYDDRSRYAAEWATPVMRARLTRLADILERWTLPAVREVFDPEYQPAHGAGGRWWHIFRTGVTQPTVDQAGLPRTMCTHYSEVATTLASDVPVSSDDQVEVVAGYLIHEYAHHAEDVIAVRKWGNVFARGTPGWSGVSESWAQSVQETAARLASGQATGARYDPLTPGSGVPYADFYTTGYGERPDLSPWAGGRGPYDQGTRLLMFLREQWGDAALGTAHERFYGRVLGLPTYDFASMARLAGLEPVTALDRWSLAEATDDLVDPVAASRSGLPQLRTWVPQDRQPVPRVSRAADSVRPVAVAHGSYAALYYPADQTGASLTFSQIQTTPFVVRITRVR